MEAAVDAEAKRVKTLQEAAGVKPQQQRRRTAVTNNGGGGDDTTVQEHAEVTEDDGSEAERLLQEAGIEFASAYGVRKPGDDKPDKPNNDGGGE